MRCACSEQGWAVLGWLCTTRGQPALLGPVPAPVLGECEPVMSLSLAFSPFAQWRLYFLDSPHKRPCTWHQAPHAFLAWSGLCWVFLALRYTHDLDTQHCLSGRLAPVWSSPAKPVPRAPLGPTGGTGCVSRPSAACLAWPGPKFPFQPWRHPPSPPPHTPLQPKLSCTGLGSWTNKGQGVHGISGPRAGPLGAPLLGAG